MSKTQSPLQQDAPVDRFHLVANHPLVKLAVPLIVLTIAGFVLQKLAQDVDPAHVFAQIRAMKPQTLGLAVLATTASYLAIAFYDVISLHAIAPGVVKPRNAYVIGGAGYAISNLLGLSYLTGSAVRLRAYVAAGVPFSRAALALATSFSGFWSGLALLTGSLMLFHPAGLSAVINIPPNLETLTGAGVLLVLAVILILLGRRGRHLSLRLFGARIEADLPNARTASLLMLAGAIDLLFASLTLWLLLPPDLGGNFAYFFVIFMAAIGLGIASHSPGGLGVFEATVIAGLGVGARPDLLAALVLYRVIYTLYPFLVAMLGLTVSWLWARLRHVEMPQGLSRTLVSPLIPPLSGGIALISGVLLLLSGSLPSEGSRLELLRDVLPLPVVEFSHMTASVTGMMLIILARGLYRRLTRAWIVALVLLAAGLVTSVARGLEWEQAFTMGLAAGVLIIFKDAFYRVEGGSVFELDLNWFLSGVALLVAVSWIGFFAYKHVEYRDTLWWQFSWHGDASRFLRGELVAAVVLALIAMASLLRARHRPDGPVDIPPSVKEILARSEDAEAALVLMGDKQVLVSEDERAFLSYADTGHALIALSDPVGEEKAGRALIWQLRERADQMGRLCAFYGVSNRYLPSFLDMGLSIVKIGETARIDLSNFTLDGPKKKNFRYAQSRGARDGYRVEIIAAAQVPEHIDALRAISDAWLAQKQGEEKGFALGAFSESYVENFDCAVLRNPEGEIVAFANLLDGAGQEICIDLMRYDLRCPGYGMDMLFVGMILWAKERGFTWFRLGNAPFSGIEQHRLASFWNRLGALIYTHGERLYRFEGLRNFKEKWDPVWSPHYLASPRGLGVPRVLYEVNVLISGGVRGLVRRESKSPKS
ncbi:bifunctional lysylphosphatidylglycerol flippase/synthetase MprF [Celeribacter neptunius]|uniref:Phosphatidylglycerol lysyltransferase n=1 Tax=Celeribacter neptunius TaxID=588602 RepID=A0A1I3UFF6_9RHOB|nr:bifunctional lysylphosphatidylglycerol flippase/synthetase MprF [Celeribacter neptunius]SFJ80606.1 phosphatidylglycerol lysyltransferase [Celeribacter neptunius]